MYDLMSHAGRLVYGIQRAELGMWIVWWLPLWDLAKRGSHLLWFPVTGLRFPLSAMHGEAHVGQKDFEHDKCKSPGFFYIVTGLERAFL